MISDQGREFVNKVNEDFMALAGMDGIVSGSSLPHAGRHFDLLTIHMM